MLFDSHAHLNFKAFKDDWQEVIKRCQKNNVWLINVGSQFQTSQRAVGIARDFKEGVFAAVGLHPIYVLDEDFNLKMYLELAKDPKVVAVGETGFDYKTLNHKLQITNKSQITDYKNLQKKVLLKHLELAEKVDKPVIFHCREAHQDLLKTLKEQSAALGGRLAGVIHCFSGRVSQVKEYLDLGLYLGFTGIITYVSDYDKVIKETPLPRILIETDCPYLTPIPYRGERNEPLYVKYVAQKIAQIKNLSLEEVTKITFENTCRLFRIKS